eukprot:SAG25_NODE_722_length_5726_cov_289.638415_6_plen_255_part_00
MCCCAHHRRCVAVQGWAVAARTAAQGAAGSACVAHSAAQLAQQAEHRVSLLLDGLPTASISVLVADDLGSDIGADDLSAVSDGSSSRSDVVKAAPGSIDHEAATDVDHAAICVAAASVLAAFESAPPLQQQQQQQQQKEEEEEQEENGGGMAAIECAAAAAAAKRLQAVVRGTQARRRLLLDLRRELEQQQQGQAAAAAAGQVWRQPPPAPEPEPAERGSAAGQKPATEEAEGAALEPAPGSGTGEHTGVTPLN